MNFRSSHASEVAEVCGAPVSARFSYPEKSPLWEIKALIQMLSGEIETWQNHSMK